MAEQDTVNIAKLPEQQKKETTDQNKNTKIKQTLNKNLAVSFEPLLQKKTSECFQ